MTWFERYTAAAAGAASVFSAASAVIGDWTWVALWGVAAIGNALALRDSLGRNAEVSA